MNTSLTHLVHYQVAHQGYDAIAHCYNEGRVDYPYDIVKRLLEATGYASNMVICDLAAGTGKLTKALLHHYPNAQITAVEPSQKMCGEFAKQFPSITIHHASADHIQLQNESVDIVTVGTAFHWFANEQSLREIARILKPGGRLALIWNIFDTQVSWVKELRQLLDVYRTAEEQTCNHDSLRWTTVFETTTLFAPLQHVSHQYAFDGSQDAIICRMRASKIFGVLSSGEQDDITATAHRILQQHHLSQATIRIPYRVELYWTRKQ